MTNVEVTLYSQYEITQTMLGYRKDNESERMISDMIRANLVLLNINRNFYI